MRALLLLTTIIGSVFAFDFGLTSFNKSVGAYVEESIKPNWSYTFSVTQEFDKHTGTKLVKANRSCMPKPKCPSKQEVKPNKVVPTKPQAKKEVVKVSTLSKTIKGDVLSGRLSFNYIYNMPYKLKGIPSIGVGLADTYKDGYFASVGYKIQYAYKKLVTSIGYEYDLGQGYSHDDNLVAQLGWRF